MESFTPVSALLGGALIGLAASILLLVHGRIAGIAGIFGESLRGRVAGDDAFRLAFLGGMIGAGLLLRVLYPAAIGESHAPIVFVALAGLLVGYGTRLGSGCTSGHGVCGLARLSKRSLVGTLTFMAAAALTVFVTVHVMGIQR